MFGHSFSVADELIRVPLLVYDPTEQLTSGRRRSIVQLNDLYLTILELAGEDPPETNSVSLLNESRDAAFVHYERADSELEYPQSAYPPFKQYATWKSPSSKLIYYPEEDRMAGCDSGELQSKLDDHLTQLNPVHPKGETQLSESVEQQLKNMGYL
ncbi:hypothetical protein [Natrialba asiatica]|uniref:hypothetical protein n=1 Tax=Natrialba asiatica TaxID=64602 RepID=UPI0012680A1A|nr:hypothetical protein [Natrialba asiatica]